MKFYRKLIILAYAIWAAGFNGAANGAEIKVPENHATIQAALAAASAGDVILIAPGTYTENLTVRGGIELQGVETARTLLQQPASGNSITISGGSDITLRNLTFIGSATSGNAISITGNAANIKIVSNVFNLGIPVTAIQINDNSVVNISNNTFIGNAAGIASSSNQTTVQNNIFSGNQASITPSNTSAAISYNCYAPGDIAMGSNQTVGQPQFVNPSVRDYHLQQNSACIDTGILQDALDNTTADAGAYGGVFADMIPYPIAQLTVANVSAANATTNVQLSWAANREYHTAGYRIYYDFDRSGKPYTGNSAYDANSILLTSPFDTGNVTSYTLYNLLPSNIVLSRPVLTLTSIGNESAQLSWTAITGATSYRIQYGITATTENQLDVNNRTVSYTLTGLTNGARYNIIVSAGNRTTYYFNIAAIDNTPAQHESELITERSIEIGATQYSEPSNQINAIPEPIQHYPALPGAGDKRCFIATAAYGHYSAPQVQILRDFRDRYLLSSAAGRAFVEWYYTNSPAIARTIQQHNILKTSVRILLLPALCVAWFFTKASALMQILSSLALFALILLCAIKFRYLRGERHSGGNNPQKVF